MKLTKGKISILINHDYTTVELADGESGIVFAHVKLTPDQLSMALSRLARTECEIDVYGLDKLGKKLEVSEHEFEIPEGIDRRSGKDELYKAAVKTAPEGWEVENYFESQGSLFGRSGKRWARVTIRRWVNSEQEAQECDATKLNQGNTADNQK